MFGCVKGVLRVCFDIPTRTRYVVEACKQVIL